MPEQIADGWGEWSRHVLAELVRLNAQCEGIREDISELQQKVAVIHTELRLKAGAWGFIGASIPVAIMVVIQLLKVGGS
jgi:hypothetical protein